MPKDCRLKISVLEDIWDILLVGCVSLSADGGTWAQSNELTSEFLGYADQELWGKSLSQVTAPSDWELEAVLMQRIVAGYDDSYTLAKQFITRDGRHRWARVQANKVVPQDGNPFLMYQIIPGEIEVQAPAEPVTLPDETRSSSPLIGFIKSHWKTLLWLVGTLVMGVAKGYHTVETWRMEQERQVEALTDDVRQINANIELLIKNLDK